MSYSGPGSIVSLTLDGAGANPTGLGVRGPDPSAGLVFDPRPFLAIPALGGPDLFAQGFPFTGGGRAPAIDPSAIAADFAGPGVGLASRRQFQQMTVRFPAGALGGGRSSRSRSIATRPSRPTRTPRAATPPTSSARASCSPTTSSSVRA